MNDGTPIEVAAPTTCAKCGWEGDNCEGHFTIVCRGCNTEVGFVRTTLDNHQKELDTTCKKCAAA